MVGSSSELPTSICTQCETPSAVVTHWEGCISTVGSRLDGGGGGGEGHCSTYEVRVLASAAGLGDVVDDAKSSNCGASSVPVRVIEKQLPSPWLGLG